MNPLTYCLSLLLLKQNVASATGGLPADTVRRSTRVENHLALPTRRWRGKVGQQPVTVFLDSSYWRGAVYSGMYFYDHFGKTIFLSDVRKKGTSGIALGEHNEAGRTTGILRLGPTLAPQLVGSWRSADGRRQLPVQLHEDYEGAVQVQEEHWNLTRFLSPDSLRGMASDSAQYQADYLRVVLPQNPAAALRIEKVLGPPAASPQMAYYLDALLRDRQRDRPDYSYIGEKYVVYNSNNLFSVMQSDRFTAVVDSGYDHHEWTQGYTFDLRTGKQLGLADLLTGGYQAKLRQLIIQKLQKVWKENVYYDEVGSAGKLPASGFVVTGTGLNFSFDDRDDESLASPGPYHADRIIEVEIPYEALLPLIKLAGPLAPLLRERNLLPKE